MSANHPRAVPDGYLVVPVGEMTKDGDFTLSNSFNVPQLLENGYIGKIVQEIWTQHGILIIRKGRTPDKKDLVIQGLIKRLMDKEKELKTFKRKLLRAAFQGGISESKQLKEVRECFASK